MPRIVVIFCAISGLNLQDLDIAIVKATNHVECPPKERHLRSECFLFLGAAMQSLINLVGM